MNGRARSSSPLPLPANQLLRHARSRSGRSWREVADLSGVPESVVVLFALGRRVPTWDQLQQVVMACGFWLDVHLRELRLAAGAPLVGPLSRRRGAGPGLSARTGVDLDSATYLGHRLRVVREELAAMASSLEAVAESFKDEEWRHYERFSRLVVILSVPSLDLALASLERELRLVRTSVGQRRGGRHRSRTPCIGLDACARLADRVAHARHHLAMAAARLRAERLQELAYAVELQDRELGEIEQAFGVCREAVGAAG